jgi:hypothetical protein
MASFKTLWDNFPDVDDVKAKCFNKQAKSSAPFDDYCAILLSECFLKEGLAIDKATGNRCWSHAGSRHLLLAEQFANWLSNSPPAGFGTREKIPPGTFQKELAGRTGVLFFKDYWQRQGQSEENRSGDHIDLWSKSRITGSSMIYRGLIEWLGLVSDLNKSREIWFWEVK